MVLQNKYKYSNQNNSICELFFSCENSFLRHHAMNDLITDRDPLSRRVYRDQRSDFGYSHNHVLPLIRFVKSKVGGDKDYTENSFLFIV